MGYPPLLEFIERNSSNLFLRHTLPEKMIDNTNNAAEIVFSIFKPQYKVMKRFQMEHRLTLIYSLRHNFRKFPRGKRKGLFPIQLEGLDIPTDDWSELIFQENKDFRVDPDSIAQYLEKQAIRGVVPNLHP